MWQSLSSECKLSDLLIHKQSVRCKTDYGVIILFIYNYCLNVSKYNLSQLEIGITTITMRWEIKKRRKEETQTYTNIHVHKHTHNTYNKKTHTNAQNTYIAIKLTRQ